MIIRRSVGLRGFGATLTAQTSSGTVNLTSTQMIDLMTQARQSGTLTASAPTQSTQLDPTRAAIITEIDPGSFVPDVLTDSSGKIDPTRLAIFGLGAVGLIAGILMLKTKRG